MTRRRVAGRSARESMGVFLLLCAVRRVAVAVSVGVEESKRSTII